ncbi:MAG: hypothetical protein AAB296_10270 [Candidatus Desantisbacteria bacterium]
MGIFQEILRLKDDIDAKIVTLNRKAEKGREFVNYLYSKPIVSIDDVVNICKITPKSAISLVGDFEKLGILKELTGYKRNRLFAFEDYLQLFQSKI